MLLAVSQHFSCLPEVPPAQPPLSLLAPLGPRRPAGAGGPSWALGGRHFCRVPELSCRLCHCRGGTWREGSQAPLPCWGYWVSGVHRRGWEWGRGLGAGATGASAGEGAECSPHGRCCLAPCRCEHHRGQETRVTYAASPAAPRFSGPARSPPVGEAGWQVLPLMIPGFTSCLSSSPPTFGLPGWLSGKESACQCRRHKRHRLDPWVGKIPQSRKWQPTPVFLPGESHRQRSLVGYSPRGHKDVGTAEHVHAPPTFKGTGVWNSPASWCIRQMQPCWVVDVLLVIDGRGKTKGMSHSSMMLLSLIFCFWCHNLHLLWPLQIIVGVFTKFLF